MGNDFVMGEKEENRRNDQLADGEVRLNLSRGYIWV
jgi:hypothetical protein